MPRRDFFAALGWASTLTWLSWLPSACRYLFLLPHRESLPERGSASDPPVPSMACFTRFRQSNPDTKYSPPTVASAKTAAKCTGCVTSSSVAMHALSAWRATKIWYRPRTAHGFRKPKGAVSRLMLLSPITTRRAKRMFETGNRGDKAWQTRSPLPAASRSPRQSVLPRTITFETISARPARIATSLRSCGAAPHQHQNAGQVTWDWRGTACMEKRCKVWRRARGGGERGGGGGAGCYPTAEDERAPHRPHLPARHARCNARSPRATPPPPPPPPPPPNPEYMGRDEAVLIRLLGVLLD